ncbi:hypothetical protein G9A89_016412 [Geosiphon pyriformis]|nr:hypothetical protein G9A89_016412 [Geosiphon pyriformis]
MNSNQINVTTTDYPDTEILRGKSDDPYMTTGALIYSVLSTISIFLMCVLCVIYGRLNYNRVFFYFCVSIVMLYIPHVLGAWIAGANLARWPNALCWIQGLWINTTGIAGGMLVSIYSFEIYRSIVWHKFDDEYKRKRYYFWTVILFPFLIGFIGPIIVANKPYGIQPGPYFCLLYKPKRALAFVSIEGWNTLFSIPGIYFSFRTAIEVARIIFTSKGFDPMTTIKQESGRRRSSVTRSQVNADHVHLSHDIEAAFTIPYSPTTPTTMTQLHSPIPSNPPARTPSSLSDRTIASIPIYACIRLVSFGLLYSGVTVGVYGRNLYHAIRETNYDFKPSYLDYLIASLGIIIFVVFGTSVKAIREYGRFFKILATFNWLKVCILWLRRDQSFGDWEIQEQRKQQAENANRSKVKEMQQHQRRNQHQRDDSRANVLDEVMEVEEEEADDTDGEGIGQAV